MKYTKINGVYFETIKSKKTEAMINYHDKNFNHRDLSDYYEKPSEAKRAIYTDWIRWYLEADETIYNFEITSANTFGFTFGGLFVDSETFEIIGYIRITKEHNRLYLIP